MAGFPTANPDLWVVQGSTSGKETMINPWHLAIHICQEDKGPSAKDVMLLGSAGNQVQQMKAMGYTWGGKGDWGGKGGFGKGWDWGKGGGYGGYWPEMWMPMQMPVWGKGYGKGW